MCRLYANSKFYYGLGIYIFTQVDIWYDVTWCHRESRFLCFPFWFFILISRKPGRHVSIIFPSHFSIIITIQKSHLAIIITIQKSHLSIIITVQKSHLSTVITIQHHTFLLSSQYKNHLTYYPSSVIIRFLPLL